MTADDALTNAVTLLGNICDPDVRWNVDADQQIRAAEILLKWQAANGEVWVWKPKEEEANDDSQAKSRKSRIPLRDTGGRI